MKKMLTKKQAWIWIARKFEGPMVNECGKFYVEYFGKAYGICDFAVILFCKNQITSETHWTIRTNFRPGYNWPLTREGAKQRAKFCRKMARECK